MISFIIPAHNEEALIGRTLSAIHQAASPLTEAYEVIVADDASTDATAARALEQGARVVRVNHRQIAATRNAGARAARGEIFIFVDADTAITPRALQAALRALHTGAVGGGCCVRLDRPLPPYAVVLERVLRAVAPLIGLAGGCFLFCTRRTYLRAGGFDEAYFASEEVGFSSRLKRQGRFVVLRESVLTSGRKLRAHTGSQLLGLFLRLALAGPKSLRQRDGLEWWYARGSMARAATGGIIPKAANGLGSE